MVHQTDLKAYRFDITGYFDYILESMGNGNYTQVSTLFLKLSKKQREEFLLYLIDGKSGLTGKDCLNLSTLRHCIPLIY